MQPQSNQPPNNLFGPDLIRLGRAKGCSSSKEWAEQTEARLKRFLSDTPGEAAPLHYAWYTLRKKSGLHVLVRHDARGKPLAETFHRNEHDARERARTEGARLGNRISEFERPMKFGAPYVGLYTGALNLLGAIDSEAAEPLNPDQPVMAVVVLAAATLEGFLNSCGQSVFDDPDGDRYRPAEWTKFGCKWWFLETHRKPTTRKLSTALQHAMRQTEQVVEETDLFRDAVLLMDLRNGIMHPKQGGGSMDLESKTSRDRSPLSQHLKSRGLLAAPGNLMNTSWAHLAMTKRTAHFACNTVHRIVSNLREGLDQQYREKYPTQIDEVDIEMRMRFGGIVAPPPFHED